MPKELFLARRGRRPRSARQRRVSLDASKRRLRGQPPRLQSGGRLPRPLRQPSAGRVSRFANQWLTITIHKALTFSRAFDACFGLSFTPPFSPSRSADARARPRRQTLDINCRHVLTSEGQPLRFCENGARLTIDTTPAPPAPGRDRSRPATDRRPHVSRGDACAAAEGRAPAETPPQRRRTPLRRRHARLHHHFDARFRRHDRARRAARRADRDARLKQARNGPHREIAGPRSQTPESFFPIIVRLRHFWKRPLRGSPRNDAGVACNRRRRKSKLLPPDAKPYYGFTSTS